MTAEDRIQAEIDLLHKQLDAKQLELDNKYAERKALKRKLTNIERNFLEDEMQSDADYLGDLASDYDEDFPI